MKLNNTRLTFFLLASAVAAATIVYLQPYHKTPIVLEPNNAAIVQQGRQIYSAHCAYCHGGSLEGQPNWRQRDAAGYLPAPPQDASGHTWHHSDKQLFELTKIGLGAILDDKNFRTRMPAYKDQLSDSEIIAVLSFIKSRWPADIQARHDKVNAARQPGSSGS